MEKKNILITGGSQGIGKVLSEKLAVEGHNVVFTYNNSKKEAEELKKKLAEKKINIDLFKCDVSSYKQVVELKEYFFKKYEKIDVLINNAGISKICTITNTSNEDWDEIINTNLTSAFYTTKEFIPNMINNKEGLIINISSMWGITGASCEVAYSVSKAGLDAMTKALAKELGPSGIRVNSIAPGIIKTNMNDFDKETETELINLTPLKKLGDPIDIYKCAKWLIEDRFTTGQIISVNGGFVI